jgi:hypothetical protein
MCHSIKHNLIFFIKRNKVTFDHFDFSMADIDPNILGFLDELGACGSVALFEWAITCSHQDIIGELSLPPIP